MTTERNVYFSVVATDTVSTLPVTLLIADTGGTVRRTIQQTVFSGTELRLAWDGRDDEGQLLPAADYTATVQVSDGLDDAVNPAAPSHTSISQALTVTLADWFAGSALAAGEGDQQYPAASNSRVVWQDRRNGNWDIYLKDLADGSLTRISTDSFDQERPALDGDWLVWQDHRNGSWDIYAFGLDGSSEQVVSDALGDQEQPSVSGSWIAWQDNRSGNWDIWAKNITTGEQRQITSHERDQIHPVLHGTILVWEDYRYGYGDIFKYDLTSGVETRITFDSGNQTSPTVFADQLLWTDQRDGHKEIYRRDSNGVALRITYGDADRSQPALNGGLLVYTDYTAGLADPNLSFLDLVNGNGGKLTSSPAKQEESAIGDGVVVWQDDRDGRWQIYQAALEVVPLPVDVELRPGFNLIAVGQQLVADYTTARNLIDTPPTGVDIARLLHFSTADGQFTEVDTISGDFDLSSGSALILYARSAGTLRVADGNETARYNLLTGPNYVGLLSIPFGYRAFDLVRSLGLDKVVSVRRFDSETGLWQTAAVRSADVSLEIVGNNFAVRPGEGLVVTLKQPLDSWQP